MNHPPTSDPAADAIRKHLVEEALASDHLRRAIERALCRRGSSRWLERITEAQEIEQEVALRALDRLATFDHQATLPLPWLMGIAANVMRERARHPFGEKKPVIAQSSCTDEQWNRILDRLSVEPRAAEEPSPVRQALARLKPDEQRVIGLRYLEDRSYSAIAQAFGVTEVAARARLCRALQSLRRQLPPDTAL